MKHRRASLWVALLACVLAAWACNYPRETPTVSTPAAQMQAAQETLAALATAGTAGATELPALPTGTPVATAALLATQPPAIPSTDPNYYAYTVQPGDTRAALALRFAVAPETITEYGAALPATGLLTPGRQVQIPRQPLDAPYGGWVLPDSEVIDSPTSVGFDLSGYIQQAGGTLSLYRERVAGEDLSGADIVRRVSLESSVNPRLLLAWIELRSGWVLGQPAGSSRDPYPIGFEIPNWEGLYKELVISATHLNAGYYGWRDGSLTEVTFREGNKLRLAPELNAGTAGLQNLFVRLYDLAGWQAALYGPQSIAAVYTRLFGDPWARSAALGPLLPNDLAQPLLVLPFAPGERWSLTGGPHLSWKTGSPRGAIDLAPVTGEAACAVSRAWVTASVGGLVARSERNVVVIDLDGDGREQTGWTLLFLHLADAGRVADGVQVAQDDRLGHPSCEGGVVTGAHVHLARKYNGEWLAADGPLPFVLSGWQVYAGEKNYQGGLRNGSQEVVASPVGPRTSIIVR